MIGREEAGSLSDVQGQLVARVGEGEVVGLEKEGPML